MKQEGKNKQRGASKKEFKYRNRKPSEEKRTARVTISLKPSEKESLAGLAKKSNKTLSDLIYYKVTNRRIKVKVVVPEHTEALRLIATMSNNINQIAHDANAAILFGQRIPEATISALDNVLARLDEIMTNKSD